MSTDSQFPLRQITLVRHGQSMANTKELNPQLVGDHTIPLTPIGWEQARKAGKILGAELLQDKVDPIVWAAFLAF